MASPAAAIPEVNMALAATAINVWVLNEKFIAASPN
jgi:hypothetical protein